VGALKHILDAGVPAELWIVGDGGERAALEQQIESLGIRERVRFHGYQSNPSALVRQCDIYVQPSLTEGFGIALVEAMGCAVPVIATAVGGAPEIIEDGRTGWLIRETTPERIAAALLEAWKHGPERLFEMGQAARASVEGRFEPVIYVRELEALYGQIAAERGIVLPL
jgi:glycosyltransferase involved in cell wall biosynthesis